MHRETGKAVNTEKEKPIRYENDKVLTLINVGKQNFLFTATIYQCGMLNRYSCRCGVWQS